MEKNNIHKIIFFILVVLSTLSSCSGLFEEEEVENKLPKPVVTVTDAGVTISCNASVDDNVVWVNVFRRRTTDTNDGDFINIGQILPYTGQTFSNSAQFIDEYVTPGEKYDYLVRYARKKGSSISYEKTEEITITATGNGREFVLMDDSSSEISGDTPLVFSFDDETYTLETITTVNPSDATGEVCVAVSNGTRTITVPLVENENGGSRSVVLRDVLPDDFLDVVLTCDSIVGQIVMGDDTNKFSTYHWSKSVAIKIQKTDVTDAEDSESITVPSSAVASSNIDYNPM